MESETGILIVDDEAAIGNLFKTLLLKNELFSEMKIYLAKNGAEGIELFKCHNPGIIVTDLKMPVISGTEMISTIREFSTEVQIVVMSAYEDFDEMVQLFQLGVLDFIKKPFNFLYVVSFIKKLKERILISKQNVFLKQSISSQEKFTCLGILAGGIAHEINNPNTFIKGNVEVIQLHINNLKKTEALSLSPSFKKTLEDIEASLLSITNGANRISKITSSMRQYAKTTPGKKESFKLEELFTDVHTLTSFRLKPYQYEVIKPSEDLLLKGNRTDLAQSIIAVLLNAVDAVEDRSQVKPPYILCEIESADSYLLITISDNGVGIDEAHSELVFAPFFSTKNTQRSSGLGLSTAKGVVEFHGGTITHQPNTDGGTIIKISLPIIEVHP